MKVTKFPLPPEQARLRLYEAIGAFLVVLTASQPLLLVLDDLQWADLATLDLLSHVARHQPRARLLVLGAYREGEVIQHSAFERMLVELTPIRQLSTFTLGPLIAGELVELVGRMLGASLDSAAGELLVVHSLTQLSGRLMTDATVSMLEQWQACSERGMPLNIKEILGGKEVFAWDCR